MVGKFVEFHGEGAASLSVPDRATIGNMAPEYGATIGFFPVDEQTCRYLQATGRSDEHVETVRRYFQAQGLFGMPARGQCDYTTVLDVDLADIEPSVAGPKRPQDRIALGQLKEQFLALLTSADGYGKPDADVARAYGAARQTGRRRARAAASNRTRRFRTGARTNTNTLTETEMMNNRPTPNRLGQSSTQPRASRRPVELAHGDVVIAAITSCTNTSNPAVMLAAGLLAKKAVEHGLSVKPWVKTSLAPGSRVVSEYLNEDRAAAVPRPLGLQPRRIRLHDVHRQFGAARSRARRGAHEERPHRRQRALGQPQLRGAHPPEREGELPHEPAAGRGVRHRRPGRHRSHARAAREQSTDARSICATSGRRCRRSMRSSGARSIPPSTGASMPTSPSQNPLWNQIPAATGQLYEWDPASLYIREPPYFDPSMAAAPSAEFSGARALAIFGDSVTTDHISPAGAIKPTSPAGDYLRDRGVPVEDFNSYGARRGNHEVMVRGTFANVRIRNLMVPGVEGGVTRHQPDGERMGIYDAAERYRAEGVPLIVIAGQDYGAGSSRDWAAKGTRLLGVRAVIARGFERIHRSNLIGMGVLPCQFPEGVSAQTLGLDGTERFDLALGEPLRPRQPATLHIERRDGRRESVPLVLRIDTPIEAAYFSAGGIMPYVLEQLAPPQERRPTT